MSRRLTDKPIINSMLDLDFYKINIMQLAFLLYWEVPVEFQLINRTKSIRLADHIDIGRLREELEHVRTLRANVSEISFLRGVNVYSDRMFNERFLQYFAQLQLADYSLREQDGQFVLSFSGTWPTVTLWETIALSIINELYYESLMIGMTNLQKERVMAEGIRRLGEKIDILKKRPDITFSDFGTRRRFSHDWQCRVDQFLLEELPRTQFRGTSNTLFAYRYGLTPMGTYPHEGPMVYTGIFHESDEDIRASHNTFLQDWWNLYGEGLSVALSDTFGTDFFFRDMSLQQAQTWKGLRHDSNEPVPFGYRSIDFYKSLEIDPTTKLIVFSDGLDINSIVSLADEFEGKIQKTFGWGTTLTNDLGFGTMSLVAKVMRANGHRTVKLSDNIAKATGHPDDIERFKRVFDYHMEYSRVPVV